MRLLPAVLLTLVMSWSAFGQTYTISTVAGGALPVNIPGTSASLGGEPTFLFARLGDRDLGIATDAAGNSFIASNTYNIVLRLDATTGILTLVAGNGAQGFSGDNGPATSAQLNNPRSVAVDSAGNVYIADEGNARIRKVSNGVITTVAGNGTVGFSGDNGPATSAHLRRPEGVAVDPAGILYIADFENSRVRRVSNGVITTVAGNGTQGFSGDNGPATSAQLIYPTAVAVDATGNLYIADINGQRIRRVSNGIITTAAGNGTAGFSGDNGPATSAQLYNPSGIAVDSAGNLYIADGSTNGRIRRVANGVITTVVGNGTKGFGDGGPATSAQLNNPTDVAVDSVGNLYIADTGNRRIRRVTNGVITTIAGGGSSLGDNGPATSAQFSTPVGVAVDSSGNLYVADVENNRIRKVSNGVITTVAGNGATQLSVPAGVTVDPAGNIYIADAQGILLVANGVPSRRIVSGFFYFHGVTLDSAGNLYVADVLYNRISKVSNGVVTTVAGGGSSLGDNGPATSAQLSNPNGVAVDSAGDLYIADTGNHRIRKVSNGVITTVAGNGTQGFSGDNGPATSAQLYFPQGVAVDSAGNLYIADAGNGRIRRVSNGMITTIAGGASSLGDNGPATSAQLSSPQSLTVDLAGNVYVADAGNQRVRVLTPVSSSCTYSVSPTSLQAPASGGNLTVNIQTTASCSWTVSALPSWITVSGAASGAGSATVTLVVSPNPGPPLNATISVAGVSVTIAQPSASGCTYAINPGGQAFAAIGGTGTINITAGPGCSWTAASTASWVTITGVGAGTGNGSISYQVAVNTGGARSGGLTIAGVSFTVEEASASIAGFTNAGSMAQLASAGYWKTTITLINTGTAAAQARLNFFDDNGNPLLLPLYFPQTSSAGPLLASTVDRTVNAGAVLVIETTGPDSAPTQVGWAQLLTNGTVGGFAVFRQAIGSSSQEAVVPLENRNASGYVLFFDNTNGSATGVALANTTTQVLNTAITIRDDTGAAIMSDTITLPASGHTSFNLVDRYASITAQRRGTLEFRTPAPGQISVLGVRFNATGAFSTIPALAK